MLRDLTFGLTINKLVSNSADDNDNLDWTLHLDNHGMSMDVELVMREGVPISTFCKCIGKCQRRCTCRRKNQKCQEGVCNADF